MGRVISCPTPCNALFIVHCSVFPTLPFLQQKFDELNALIFAGRLPHVPLLLGNAKSYLGQCLSTKERRRDGKVVHTHFRLRFSQRHDLSPQEWEDVLIHEMIHLYIGVNKWQDSSSHGPVFRQLMDEINRHFGRQVAISHRATPAPDTPSSTGQTDASHGVQADVSSATGQTTGPSGNPAIGPCMSPTKEQRVKPRYHVVALVRMTDGRTGLKVLPRIEQRILHYYQAAMRSTGVASVALYMACDAYFERFPNSSVLRVHFLPEEEILPHLQQAEVLKTDGRRIIRTRRKG